LLRPEKPTSVLEIQESHVIRTTSIQTGKQADDDWQNRALVLRSHRQNLLATNIANADTPGFRAMDFEFAEAMRSAQFALEKPTLATTAAGHAETNFFAPPSNTLEFVRYTSSTQMSLDGNTVDMNRERASTAQNTILYELAIAGVADEYSDMKLAVSDPAKSR